MKTMFLIIKIVLLYSVIKSSTFFRSYLFWYFCRNIKKSLFNSQSAFWTSISKNGSFMNISPSHLCQSYLMIITGVFRQSFYLHKFSIIAKLISSIIIQITMDESDNAQIVVSKIYTCKTIYIYKKN